MAFCECTNSNFAALNVINGNLCIKLANRIKRKILG